MDLGTLLASFRRDLRARKRSPRTINLYTRSVILFAEYVGGAPDDVPLDKFTRANIKDWIFDDSEKWSPNTVKTHFSGISRFGKWLVDEEILNTDPTSNVTLPSETPNSPHILSDEELRTILAQCSGRDFLSRRDAAIVRVLLDTGVRASELTAMKVSTTDLDDERTLVRGKGGKVRAIYFSPKTVSALDKYLRSRATHQYAKRDDLWITQRGTMTSRGLGIRIALLGERAGIPNLHPHRFRHTWAHDHLLNETSTVDLKRLAGWSSDTMLSRYGASGADTRAGAAARRASRGDRV